MAKTGNLKTQSMAATQNQKAQVFNDFRVAIDRSITRALNVFIPAANTYTLDQETESARAVYFVLKPHASTPLTGAFDFNFPTADRGFVYVFNDTSYTATVRISGQSSPPTLASGAAGMYIITEDSGVEEVTAGGGGGGGGGSFNTVARVAWGSNVTISTALNNGDTLDGVTLSTGDVVLLYGQTSTTENGLYIVGASPARAPGFDEDGEIFPGLMVYVKEGTNEERIYACTNDTDPVIGTDGITFERIASVVQSLQEVPSVRVSWGSNVTISTALNSGDTLDGVTLSNGDYVLLYGQTTTTENGVYTVGASPARSTEYDTSGDIYPGLMLYTREGTANAKKMFICTNPTDPAIGSDTPSFEVLNSSGGGGGSSQQTTVRIAWGSNVTISTALNNGDTLDGVTLSTGDVVLLYGQTTKSQNGLYVVGASPARDTSFDSTGDIVPGMTVYVTEGVENKKRLFACTNTSTPTIGSTAITFESIASVQNSSAVKPQVRVATTGNITLSGEQTIDGEVTDADRVLVWMQSTASQNGIYLSGTGSWTRVTDFDSDAEADAGAIVQVQEGATYGDHIFQLVTDPPITLGTTSISFADVTEAAAAYLPLTGGTLTGDLTLSTTSASNLTSLVKSAYRAVIKGQTFSNSALSSLFQGEKARGTPSSPSAVQQNDVITAFFARARGGSLWRTMGGIQIKVIAATPSDSDMESRLEFYAAQPGGFSNVEIVRMEHATGLSMFGANPVIDSDRRHVLRQYTISGLPSVATAGLIAWCTDLGGGAGEVQNVSSGVWRRVSWESGVGVNSNTTNQTLICLTDAAVMQFTGTLSADRTITLSSTRRYTGARFRIIKTTSDGFKWTVDSQFDLYGGMYVDLEYDGSVWCVISSGRIDGKTPWDAIVSLSDENTTALTTGTSVRTIYAPYDLEIHSLFIGLTTQSSSGSVTVNVKVGGSTILSTSPSIAVSSDTNLSGGTAAVLSSNPTTVSRGSKITFDISAAGTGAKGLKVYMQGLRKMGKVLL